jgi:hypothetical protein
LKTSEVFAKADAAFEQLMDIPASSQRGRASKVRCLLVHAKPGWRGSEVDDWSDEQARKLLAEFAGMSEGEIGNV